MPSKPRKLLIKLSELEPVCTLEEVSWELGISRERVRQIEARALYKLRQALLARGYTAADLLDDGVGKALPAKVAKAAMPEVAPCAR